MTKKFLILPNMTEAETFVSDADINMGYPKGKTLHYTKATKYLVGDKYMVLVCPQCYGIMSQDQIDSLKTRDQVIADGGLPELQD